MRVIVVGAGVVGLTCAVRLLEAGHRVDVVARDLPLETTSAVAAAIWYPYRALPRDKVTSWATTSYAVFDALADTDPESGVRMMLGHRGVPEGATRPMVGRRRPGAGPGDEPAGRLCRRLDLRDARGRDAGVPPVAGGPGGGARRHAHPDEPPGPARGRRPRRQLLRSRSPAARGGPLGGAGPRTGGVRRAGGPRPMVARRRRPDVRRPAGARHRRRRLPTRRGSGAAPPTRTWPARSWPGGRDWCRSCGVRGCCGTRSACGRCGPPYASSGRGTSSTATATVARGDPELGRGRRGRLPR